MTRLEACVDKWSIRSFLLHLAESDGDRMPWISQAIMRNRTTHSFAEFPKKKNSCVQNVACIDQNGANSRVSQKLCTFNSNRNASIASTLIVQLTHAYTIHQNCLKWPPPTPYHEIIIPSHLPIRYVDISIERVGAALTLSTPSTRDDFFDRLYRAQRISIMRINFRLNTNQPTTALKKLIFFGFVFAVCESSKIWRA